MKRFSDSEDTKWDVAITIGDVQRIEGALGINLLEPALAEKGEPAGNETGKLPLSLILQSNLLRFYDVLQILLEPDAAAREITPADFGRRLSGECLQEAHVAFFHEWRDFFLQLRQNAKADIVEKTAELVKLVYEMAERQTKSLDVTETMKAIEKEIAAMDGNSSGTSPES